MKIALIWGLSTAALFVGGLFVAGIIYGLVCFIAWEFIILDITQLLGYARGLLVFSAFIASLFIADDWETFK